MTSWRVVSSISDIEIFVRVNARKNNKTRGDTQIARVRIQDSSFGRISRHRHRRAETASGRGCSVLSGLAPIRAVGVSTARPQSRQISAGVMEVVMVRSGVLPGPGRRLNHRARRRGHRPPPPQGRASGVRII